MEKIESPERFDWRNGEVVGESVNKMRHLSWWFCRKKEKESNPSKNIPLEKRRKKRIRHRNRAFWDEGQFGDFATSGSARELGLNSLPKARCYIDCERNTWRFLRLTCWSENPTCSISYYYYYLLNILFYFLRSKYLNFYVYDI